MKQVGQISKIFDADKTGSIDYTEFVKFCETNSMSEAIRGAKSASKKSKKTKEDAGGSSGAAVAGAGGKIGPDKNLNDYELNVRAHTQIHLSALKILL